MGAAFALTLLVTLQDVQPPPDPSLESMLMGAVNRARRAIAFGPSIGGAVVYAPSPATGDGEISFGLELNWFKVPIVPDLATIKELIQERFKARIKERIMHLQRPADEELIRQVYEDVKNEVLGEMNVRPHAWEDPQATLALEAGYLFRSEAWQVRILAALGVSKFTIGPVLTIHAASINDFYVGAELGTHFLLGDGPRAPVVSPFIRFEVPTITHDVDPTLLIFGARLQLDLI